MVGNKGRPALVLFLFISGLAPSAYAILNRWDLGYVERPIFITAPPQKRDALDCPASYSLCPDSVSGGCCPTGLSCGVTSCYPPTDAPPPPCPSTSGYYACGLDKGGGCCPNGYSCDTFNCIPPAGSSDIQTCNPGSYLCPSSMEYGCCPETLACGVGYCYATIFSTVPVTVTSTTTISGSITKTFTTVIQTAYTASSAKASVFPSPTSFTVTKYTSLVTGVAKVQVSSDSSNGLPQAELGGIIGAAVFLVIVVLIATYLILRRLNAISKKDKSADAGKLASGSNTKSSSRPRRPTGSGGYSGPDLENIENMSIDPLMMSESDTSQDHSSTGLPRPSAVYSTRSDTEPGGSPPIPAPYGSPQAYFEGYQQVPMSEPHYSDSNRHSRNQSADSPNRSHSPRGGNVTGYFDIDPALRDQNLRHGHAPSRPGIQSHGRQWSDASDVSQQSGSSGVVELEAGPDGDRRSSLQRAIQGVSFTRKASNRRNVEGRRRSSSGGASSVRWDFGAAPGMSYRLENVQEAELDSNEKGTGPPTSERGAQVPKEKTTYQSQFHEMGITAMGSSGPELERLEQQKVIGNLGDVRRDPTNSVKQ